MRQLTFIKPGTLEWWDVPEPHIEAPLQALVRPVAVASCDIDAPILRGEVPFSGPFAFGHEFVAEVVEVGEAVLTIRVGQLVVVPFQISCGTCDACRRGFTGNCAMVEGFASYGLGKGGWGGALSDLVRVPFADAMLVPVPVGVTPEAVASASDNLPDAWRTVGPHLLDHPGSPVLIVGGAGSGSIGLYAAAIARALGASQVDYADQDTPRLEIAQALGVNALAIGSSFPKQLGRYPLTVDAGANTEGLACALRSTEREGRCISTSIYFAHNIPLPLRDMYYTGVVFQTGRVHARAVIPEVLTLVREARLEPEKVTTEVALWEEAPAALSTFHTKLLITRERREYL
jgi:threonine dehydrogenase-like Zn-dependent dehydrogenase